jgi:hypothetical protein
MNKLNSLNALYKGYIVVLVEHCHMVCLTKKEAMKQFLSHKDLPGFVMDYNGKILISRGGDECSKDIEDNHESLRR